MDREAPPSVLVIDDNPANLQVATEHLAQYAYTVLTARSGESGLRRARYTRPDLILLDIDMPGIDGYEVCRRLKALPETRPIPVVFMTAADQPEDKVRAFELGGVDYVTKPFDASELLARVRVHLALSAQRRRIATRAAQLDDRAAEASARYRQESGRLEAALAERDRLLKLVELQSEQIQRLTGRWISDRERADRDMARYLRDALSERLRLVAGALEQTAHLIGDAPAAESLGQARALLAPTLRDGGDVEEPLARAGPATENPLLRLSEREREVFRLLVAGRSNKEIAGALGLKATTISTYRARIQEKLEVDGVPALVRLALRFPEPAGGDQ